MGGTPITENCRDPFFSFKYELSEKKNSLIRYRFSKGLQPIKKIFS